MTTRPLAAARGERPVTARTGGVYRTPGLWYSRNMTRTSPTQWHERSAAAFIVWHYGRCLATIARHSVNQRRGG